jgi:hypothetical protein
MENKQNITGHEPIDESRIYMNHLPEREYWCEKFNCTMEELIEAVNTVGVSTEDVEEYLKTRVYR